MAISRKTEVKAELVIGLQRNSESDTRTLSIVTGYNDVDTDEKAEQLANDLNALAQIFVGGDSSSQLGGISANQLIQPASWRDNDPSDPPWTTASVTPRIIQTNTTILDSIGGGGGGETGVIELDYDSDDNLITITYTGEGTPKAFKGDTELTLRAGAEHYWFIENVTSGTYYVFGGGDAKVLNV